MRSLTKIVAPALFAAISLGAALPASAHEGPRPMPEHHTPVRDDSIRADIYSLRAKIDRAAARHAISSREASGLRRDAARIQRLYAQYSHDGLSRREVQTLRTRIDKVQFALHMERADRDNHRH